MAQKALAAGIAIIAAISAPTSLAVEFARSQQPDSGRIFARQRNERLRGSRANLGNGHEFIAERSPIGFTRVNDFLFVEELRIF